MHALYAHVPELVKLYQNLAYYTQQGMEKRIMTLYLTTILDPQILVEYLPLSNFFLKTGTAELGGCRGCYPPPPLFSKCNVETTTL